MDRGETKASQGQDTAERNERGRERRREEEKNSTESAIPRPPAAEVEVSHMPLKTFLSPAALRDEASTFLLPLINATSQLVGYDTWRESRRPRQASSAPLETWQGRPEAAEMPQGERRETNPPLMCEFIHTRLAVGARGLTNSV